MLLVVIIFLETPFLRGLVMLLLVACYARNAWIYISSNRFCAENANYLKICHI